MSTTDVTVISKEIELYQPIWKKIEDFRDMQTVKDEEKTYLKPLPGLMSNDTDFYSEYRQRAVISPAVDVAVITNTGMILRTQPTIPEYKTLPYINDNIDNCGSSLSELIAKVTEELNETQFCGVLVDYSRIDDETQLENLTVAEAKKLGRQAIATFYPALSITNFGLFNDGRLRFVVLKESYIDKKEGDDLAQEKKDQYRLLIMREGVYYNEVYREDENDNFIISEMNVPLSNNKTMEEIPFVFFNGVDNTPNIYKPKLKYLSDLVNVDYADSADYKYNLHYSALATKTATGVTKDEADTYSQSGPNVMYTSERPEANFGMLEFSGAVAESLVNNLNANKELISSQVLNSMGIDIKGEQSATEANYKQAGKTVSLITIANSVETGINAVIDLIFMWEGQTNTEYVDINKDFETSKIDPQLITALFNALMSGKITFETWFNNLKKAELIGDDKDVESYEGELESMAPDRPNMGAE